MMAYLNYRQNQKKTYTDGDTQTLYRSLGYFGVKRGELDRGTAEKKVQEERCELHDWTMTPAVIWEVN